MKLLAIGDTFIPKNIMAEGLNELEKYEIHVEAREWEHENLEMLQKDNLIVEQQGPEVIDLPENLINDIADYDILVIQFMPVSTKLIDRAKNLKLICVLRGGTENVACDYAASKGISVMNTPGRNARAVAEFTMGMVLSEIRNIARAHAAMKQGDWRKDFPNSGSIPELNDKTAGIVGYGAIGRMVAGYLKAFGCKVIAYDPFIKQSTDGVELVDLKYLFKNSDLICIHARLTNETYHLVGKDEIACMKPTAILVNTARSGLVDETSLKKALAEKKIGGAALDVFDNEPLQESDEFLKLDNVTITSHMAGSTRDAFTNSPKMMKDIIIRLISGNQNLPVVNGKKPKLG